MSVSSSANGQSFFFSAAEILPASRNLRALTVLIKRRASFRMKLYMSSSLRLSAIRFRITRTLKIEAELHLKLI